MSALLLLPLRNAGAEPRARGEGREVSARVLTATRSFSFWDLLARVLAKASVRIDPDGNQLSAQTEPTDQEREKASVRIDPDGNH